MISSSPFSRMPQAPSDRPRVLELSAEFDDEYAADLGGDMLTAYAGPHHLASLLLACHEDTSKNH
jgi:hypothetical protein